MKHRLPRKVLVVILLIALMGAGFFTLNSVRRAVYWADPAHRDQAPEAWMTLGYIERSPRLPPRSLGPMLGIEHAGHQSLKQIAAARSLLIYPPEYRTICFTARCPIKNCLRRGSSM